MKRISERVRELRPSQGMFGDHSYMNGWGEATEKAAELVEQLEESGIIERGREIICCYCDQLVWCEPADPSEQEQAAAEKAFVEHDAACDLNPLVARVRELEQRLVGLSPEYVARLQTKASEVPGLTATLDEALARIADLQSQLAWTSVENGLPTEPGVYAFLRNTDCVTVDSVDIWRLDTELQSCTEWYWKDHDWFESPLKVGGYRWFRRIELPEAK